MFNIKKVDCALLPHCGKTLKRKVQRVHYIGIIWGNADGAQQAQGLNLLHHGWTTNIEGHYISDWFTGPAEPDYLSCDSNTSEQVPQLSDDADDPDDGIDNDLESELEWSDDSKCETEAQIC